MAEEPCLKIEESQGVTIVRFHDASILDTTTTQRVARELYEAVEGSGNPHVVLDLENVRFISSQTLGVLLTLRRKADKVGVKVVLAGIRPELVRVFEITNLDNLFTFFDSAEAAVASFNGA